MDTDIPNISSPNLDIHSGPAVSPAGPHSSGGLGLVVPERGILDTNLGPTVPRTVGSHPSGGLGLVVPGAKQGNTGTGVGSWELVNELPSYVFSARTCLELLPLLSVAQLETEIKHLQALDANVNFRSSRSTDTKRNFLHKKLSGSLCKEVDKIVQKYDLLLHNISRSVTEAQQHVEEVEQTLCTPLAATDPVQQTDTGNTVTELKPPVSFINISFADICVMRI